jgi:O-antigen ligase
VGRGQRSGPGRRSLLAATAFVAYLAVAIFDGGQSETAIATIAIVAAWTIAIAALIGVAASPSGRGAAVAGALALLVLLIAASASWAADDGAVQVELVRALAYLGALLIVLVGVRAGAAREVLVGVAAALVVVALLALGSRLLPELLTGDRTFLEQFPAAVRGRLSYPIGYWNGLAACMAVAVVLCAWLGASARTERGRGLAVAALPAVALTLYLTGSRGGLLAGAAGLLVLLALTPVRVRTLAGVAIGIGGGLLVAFAASTDQALVEGLPDREAEWWLLAVLALVSVGAYRLRVGADRALARPRTPPLLRGRSLAVLAVLALGALFALGDGIERVSSFEDARVDEFGRGEFSGRFLAAGSNGRLQLWKAGLDAFAAEPLHGIGAGAYGYWWNQNGTLAEPARDAHSLFVEALAELGPLGLAAVLSFFGIAALAAWRRTFGDRDGAVAAAAGMLAAGAVSAAVDWTWEIPAAFALPLLAAGLLCGSGTARGSEPGPRALRSRAPRAATVLAALVAIALAGSLLLEQRALDRSRELAAEDDLAAAAAAARDATRLRPPAAEPWLQLGQVQSLAGDYEAARESFEEAVERAPESPQANLLLAVAYRVTADPRRDEQIDRALGLFPRER